MRLITAGFTFLLSLSACEQALTFSSEVRDSANGTDRLHSKVRARDGVGSFNCLVSSSGQCHYAVFEMPCGNGACAREVQAFAVKAGDALERRNLPERLYVCVDAKQQPGLACLPK